MERPNDTRDFVTGPPDHLICSICRHVFRDPHLTSCGHHFCRQCISRSLRDSEPCPLCNRNFTVFRAQNVIREVNSLEVRCPNAAAGCHWTGYLGNQNEHLLNCGYVRVFCQEGCGEYTQRRLLRKHYDILCPMRRVQCDYCHQFEGTYADLHNIHWEVCDQFPVSCPNNCSLGSIPRGRLAEHLENECRARATELADGSSRNAQPSDQLQEMQRELETRMARIHHLEATVQAQEGIIGRLRVALKEKDDVIATLRRRSLQHSQSDPPHDTGCDPGEEEQMCGVSTQFLNNLNIDGTDGNSASAASFPHHPNRIRQRNSEPALYGFSQKQPAHPDSALNHQYSTQLDTSSPHLDSPVFPSIERQRQSAPPRMPISDKRSRQRLLSGRSSSNGARNHQGPVHLPSYPAEEEEVPQDMYPGVSVKWKTCHDLPEVMYDGDATLVGEIVYVGGGTCQRTGTYENECTVFGHDSSSDSWFRLPPTNRHRFSLVTYLNQLVLVGGAIPGGRASNVQFLSSLAVWDRSRSKWVAPYPVMLTSRAQASVVAYRQYIAVTGGKNQEELESTEIYDGNSQQWSFSMPLPTSLYRASSVLSNGYWYVMGSRGQQKRAVYCVPFDSLIAIATSKRAHYTKASTNIWTSMPATDFSLATIVSVNGSLFAIGGAKNRFSVTNAVRVFSSVTNSWIPVECPLPLAFSSTAAVVISPREVLVIGGCSDLTRYKHAFRGSFTFHHSW